MLVLEHGNIFQFNQNPLFHPQVSNKFADYNAVKLDLDWMLLHYLQA